MTGDRDASPAQPAALSRGLGLPSATALNVANMIGIGPFITIPAFLATMHGPQAMLGWIAAGVLVLCDGLVWSELGAALPGSGGTYHFLKVIYGPTRWGRALPFLFIWQFIAGGTLELASGYIGMMGYVEYLVPGALARIPGGGGTVGACVAIAVTLLLCRRIQTVGWLSLALASGAVFTVLVVIVAGLANFDARALRFPEHAFRLDGAFAEGLGGAMLIAVYDYLGYYNVCHLGDEVRDPGRTIPRAVMISVVFVALCYLTMNISIIAVVPWQEAMVSSNIGATFMERLYGRPTAMVLTGLVLWTALACVFVMTLGYSRVPFAAARSGDFFRPFATLHPRSGDPRISLLALGAATAVFCFFSLEAVIKAAVTVRIAVQFIAQIAALHILRTRRPDIARPFRMRLYPLPSLIALAGWLYILGTSGWRYLLAALGVVISGLIAFVVWQRTRRD